MFFDEILIVSLSHSFFFCLSFQERFNYSLADTTRDGNRVITFETGKSLPLCTLHERTQPFLTPVRWVVSFGFVAVAVVQPMRRL